MSATNYTLRFTLDSASGLKKADTFGKSDPYCIVKVNGEQQCTSTVMKKTLDPVWDEDFTVNLNDITQTNLTLELHGKFRFLLPHNLFSHKCNPAVSNNAYPLQPVLIIKITTH